VSPERRDRRGWSRTNLLLAEACDRLGVEAESVVDEHTDYLLRLSSVGRSVLVAKTRSPFLTQVAQELANAKRVSRALLASRGIPVVPHVLLDERSDPSGPRGAEALSRWGEVVVKPNWGNRGRGVTVGVRELAVLARAYARARAVDKDEEVLVEPYVDGINMRVSIIGGCYAAAVQVDRPHVRGDGVRTIEEHVAALNLDARRGTWEAPTATQAFDVVELDDELEATLEVWGVEPGAPLPEGVELTIVGEESALVDWTEELHLGWREVARVACATLGVDVGGVDLRGPADAFRRAPPPAWRPTAAGLLEVNVSPALHLHVLPTVGAPRLVYDAFVRYCLQLEGAPPPCAAVLGTEQGVNELPTEPRVRGEGLPSGVP
jgi:cyanophycin synthetase